MKVTIELCDEEVLFGFHFIDVIAEDINSGNFEQTRCLSIGFLFFMVNIYLTPKQ